MDMILQIVNFIFPKTRLYNSSWSTLWNEKDRKTTRLISRVYFILFGLAHIFHFFLVDIPLNLQPRSLWMHYRFGVAGTCLVGLSLTFVPSIYNSRWCRIPVIISGLIFSYLQTRTMIWFSGVPYVYSIIIPSIITLLLRETLFSSFVYLTTIFILEWHIFGAVGTDPAFIISAQLVAIVAVCYLRANMSTEIDSFIRDREHLDTQKKLIETQMEVNEQIRAFLPKEIYTRFAYLLHSKKITPLEAIEETLRLRKKFICCLFSDIRGYTDGSKDLDGYVLKAAIPSSKTFTNTIETHSGIPKLIGDLVFSYFDQDSIDDNIQLAIQCAVQLILENRKMNLLLNDRISIRRYVLMSCGECVVGNIGGNDGSREITALGSAPNILSRIDELTKDSVIKIHIPDESVILTSAAKSQVTRVLGDLGMREINLRTLSRSIRNFPDETSIFYLPMSDRLIERVMRFRKVDQSIRNVDDSFIRNTGT